jgi:phosphatidylinositol alpha-1,6-mannosyltransferase
MSTCLALLTDAYGGRGGIAQYNRDAMAALAGFDGVNRIEILPRLAPDPPGETPPTVRQRPAVHNRLRYAYAAFRAAAQTRPDVVFCGHVFMAPLGALVARRARAKLVIQTHGVEAWSRPADWRRRAVEAADLILCVSRFSRAQILSWADVAPERVKVVPCTVSPAYAPGDGAAMRERLGLGGAFALLTVGRLDRNEGYKGHDRIIARLPELRAARPDLVYLIAGEGDDRPRLEALARENRTSDIVRFLGQVPFADLPDLYRASDLFVMPSTREGFGIVFLEAMACGTAALGLARGGAADALADGELGILVSEERLTEALKAALRATVDGPDLARRVQERYGRVAFQDGLRRAVQRLIEPFDASPSLNQT